MTPVAQMKHTSQGSFQTFAAIKLMKKYRLILALILLAFVGASVCVTQFLGKVYLVHVSGSKISASETPTLDLLPELVTWSEASPVKSSLTNFVCTLSTPWESPSEVELSSTNMTAYVFPNGARVVVWADSAAMMGERALRLGNTELFNGEDRLESDYAFLKSCLNSSPDQISIFKSKRTILQKTVLLILKAVINPDVHACFEYNINGRRGFQFGDPSIDDRIKLICFTSPNSAVAFDVGRACPI